MPADKPRRGRPPLKSSERRRNIISVRLRDETRRQLERAAKSQGRSLSEEAELRIERSFSISVRPAQLDATAEFGARARALAEQMTELKAELDARLEDTTVVATGTVSPERTPKK